MLRNAEVERRSGRLMVGRDRVKFDDGFFESRLVACGGNVEIFMAIFIVWITYDYDDVKMIRLFRYCKIYKVIHQWLSMNL